MERVSFKNTKHIIIYAVILISIITVLLYLNNSSNEEKEIVKQEQQFKPTDCDPVIDATAPIRPSSRLHDDNNIQLMHAKANGLKKPFKTDAQFDSMITTMVRKSILVKVKQSHLYHFKEIKFSHPYLIPEAIDRLDEIAFRFEDRLKRRKLGNYCFQLTSMLRTEEDQERLSRRNHNAAEHSTHCYGTTFDISYKDFYNLETGTIEPNWYLDRELRRTLVEMRKECEILVVKERKQSCYHITVVCCKPRQNRKN